MTTDKPEPADAAKDSEATSASPLGPLLWLLIPLLLVILWQAFSGS